MPPIQKVDKAWFFHRMKEKNLSLRKVAREMALDPGALSRAFDGGRKINSDEAAQIARILGVSGDEVLYRLNLRAVEVPATRSVLKASGRDGHSGFGPMEEHMESDGAADTNEETTGFAESPQAELEKPACRHPLFGILKGVIKIPPGVDLTEPAFPDWDEYLDRKYGKAVGEDD